MRSPAPTARRLRRPVVLLAFLAATAGATLPANGASSSLNVSLTVSSVTSLTPGGCQPGTAGVTDFGVVLPGTERVQPSTCDITFGSSNDTSMLRVAQQDGGGKAMWAPPSTSFDTGFSTDGFHRFVSLDADTPSWGAAMAPNNRIAISSEGWVTSQGNYDGAITLLDATGAPAAFGTAGTWRTADPERDQIYEVESLADGSLIGVGTRQTAAGQQYERSVVWKVTPAGITDLSFNGGLGQNSVNFTGAANERDEFRAVAIQPDGKIVAAGVAESFAGATTYDVSIVRFKADGTLDLPFGGGDGIVTLDLSGGARDDSVRGVAIQPDGKILVTGRVTTAGGTTDAFVLRTESLGVPEAGFGGSASGFKQLDIAGFNDSAWDVALDYQDRIVWIGTSDDATTTRPIVGRLLANGNEDPSFGVAGRTILPVPTYATWTGMVVLPDGRIQLAGYKNIGAVDQPLIGRVLANGNWDTSLDGDGVYEELRVGAAENMSYYDALLGRDGRIYGVGRKDGFGSKEILIGAYKATTFDDYGTNTWASPATTSLFGVCLKSVTNATAVWGATGSCGISDSDPWRAVVDTTSNPLAKAVTAASTEQNAQAKFVFGVAPASDQRPGTYLAPITLEVLAPSA
jgi:uncharacterized delta-60 repeat protein